MRFTVTQEDIARSKVLSPTWYECKITKVLDEVSKTSGANMVTFHFSVTENPSNPKCTDGTPSTGVPLKPFYITEAGIGFGIKLLEVLSNKKITPGTEVDSAMLSNAVGKKLKVYVKNEEYQGRVGNSCADFASISGEVSKAAS